MESEKVRIVRAQLLDKVHFDICRQTDRLKKFYKS